MNGSYHTSDDSNYRDGRYDRHDFGPKAWAAIYVVVLWVCVWVTRKVIARCTSHQRSRLRDDYELEFRRGGQMTNQLLLPGVGGR